MTMSVSDRLVNFMIKIHFPALLVFVLIVAIVGPSYSAEPESFADFREKATIWRALPVKPDLTESVQRFRIAAEDAFRNKQFMKAAEYYERGLAIEPLWPQGHYNAALLLGELRRYEKAALHMRYYLELVPDATNAKTAREKMYLWEIKAPEEELKEQGIIDDPEDNLQWVRAPYQTLGWHQANTYVKELTIAGGGWRLPTRSELRSLYDRLPSLGGANTFIRDDRLQFVWSSERDGVERAWCKSLVGGTEGTCYCTPHPQALDRAYALAVRLRK